MEVIFEIHLKSFFHQAKKIHITNQGHIFSLQNPIIQKRNICQPNALVLRQPLGGGDRLSKNVVWRDHCSPINAI